MAAFGLALTIMGARAPLKKGFKWVDDRVAYTGDIKKPLVFGLRDEPTDVEVASELGLDYLSKQSQKLEDWAIGKDKIQAFEQDLETKYQGEYQSAFEQKYMKDLIYEETDFETASKEFAGSDEAKLIQRR